MPIIVQPPQISQNGKSLDVTISSGEESFPLFFKTKGAPMIDCSEAWVAATLLSAMKSKAGSILVQNLPSPLFLKNLEEVQSIYQSWKPNYDVVRIESNHPPLSVNPTGSRVGLFYSAGVDSSYALLKYRDQITDLLFIQGFDIPHKATHLIQKRSEMVHRVASSMGKGVVEINTNLRKFMDAHVFWGLSHGGALACIGHLLSGEFRQIYIAPSYSTNSLRPWGSHPHLDPFWSNENLEFIHQDEALNRSFRVAHIVNDQALLENLHVCLHNLPSGLNCGKCEKCIRTMISLRALGVLNQCKTFEYPLTNWSIYSAYFFRSNNRHFVDFNLELAEHVGADQQLIKILRQIANSPKFPSIRKMISKLTWKQPGKIARKF